MEKLEREILALVAERTERKIMVDWLFSIESARRRLTSPDVVFNPPTENPRKLSLRYTRACYELSQKMIDEVDEPVKHQNSKRQIVKAFQHFKGSLEVAR